MKINIKNLKGELFSFEIEPTQTVGALKLKIEGEKGFPAESMKLIFKGKTTNNDEQLEKLGLKETDFLVIMNPVAKPQPKPKVEDKAPPPPQNSGPNNPVSTEEKQEAPKQPSSQPSNQPSQEQLADLMNMGFPREECSAALAAAFGDSNRAVDYLLNGIPLGPPQNQGQSQAPSIFAGLHNLPQFQQLRTLLQNDPNSLPEILAQISQTSPELYNAIAQHPEEFEQLIMGEGGFDEEGEGELEGEIVVTPEEEAAIGRLSALGFSKMESAQAYMACDKNEEMAANLLFDRLANGDIEQSFPGQEGSGDEEDDDNLFN